MLSRKYDLIVVGAGIAGIHAAKTAVRMGAETLLVTASWDTVGCLGWGPVYENPHLWSAEEKRGLKKAVLGAIEIEAGSAVFIDNYIHQGYWKYQLESAEKLTIFQDMCEGVGKLNGEWLIKTRWGLEFQAGAIILTVGTFMRARVRFGAHSGDGGRPGETGSSALADTLVDHGVELRGSCNAAGATIHAKGINWGRMVEVPYIAQCAGQSTGSVFQVKDDQSRLHTLAPINRRGECFYLAGAENENREDQAEEYVHRLDGLQAAEIMKPGFRVDFARLAPGQISSEQKVAGLEGLYFAGRVCGSAGYDESSRQGRTAAKAAVSRET